MAGLAVDLVTMSVLAHAFDGYLDEPDLSPRSREAFGRKLRGIKHDDKPSWLAA